MHMAASGSDSSNQENHSELWIPPLSRRTLLTAAGGAAMAMGLAACGGDDSSGTSTGTTGGAAGEPKRGGEFRLGVTGGGAKDIMDGQNIVTKPDQARLVSAFETLLVFDENYQLQTDGLAESVEYVTKGSKYQYVIKLRKGVEFHDGKTFTADDVVYSLQRIGTQKNGLTGFAATATMDIKNVKKDDDYTVILPLLTPDSTVEQTLASYTFGMVPVGYEAFSGDPSTQIGTGPYILESFTPGSESQHKRNPNYWRSGQPYFDTVRIIDFEDPTAQVNALVGGQIDAMTDLPAAQVTTVESQGAKVLKSQTGSWQPICMAIDMPPFNDPDVRMAMRLIVDRQGMIDQVVSGFGFIGNDLYAPFDEVYADDLPQREQDIDQAKSLLAKAGMDGATFELHTTNGADGMVNTAQVFATQAKAAGITVNVKNDPNYYGDDYLKLPFSVDFWGTRAYLNQVQQYEYDLGGYIIPYFGNLIDGYASNVQGLVPSKGTLNLDTFGHGFRTIWFA
jgi:peptide/nickel transport system substrate-binding protein